MATAQLGGFKPEIGLLAFLAATIGFAVFGFRRVISVGADSTLTSIFAGSLALMAASGSAQYAGLAAVVAIAVGVIVILCGRFQLGWIADLFSVPVTTGFLAGIAIHIVILQLPILLGLPAGHGEIIDRAQQLAGAFPHASLIAAGLGLSVLIIAIVAERISPRIPGALIGLIVAAIAAKLAGATASHVPMLDAMHVSVPVLAVPSLTFEGGAQLSSLVLILAIVVMLQTAATVRSFGTEGSVGDVSKTFIGVGAANIVAGLAGSMPVNTSPPRTAAMHETGAQTQIASIVAAALAVLLAFFGSTLVQTVPATALAGLLLFIAQRIVRVQTAFTVFRQTRGEFLLIAATALAIAILPMQTGIAISIVLSLLHGMWNASRTQVIELEHLPGTTVWWVPTKGQKAEKVDGVMVLGFQAPLSFLNAYEFRRGIEDAVAKAKRSVHLIVIEASGIAEIDFTAAQVLRETADWCCERNIQLAVARMESIRAQAALERFDVLDKVGRGKVFHTVEEAVRTLAKGTAQIQNGTA
jgi:MFS superfamily sulfate permease-like transporter